MARACSKWPLSGGVKKPLVVVANVFIPAVLGAKLRHLDLDNAEKVRFFGPQVCLADLKSTVRTEIRVVSSSSDADPLGLFNSGMESSHAAKTLIFQAPCRIPAPTCPGVCIQPALPNAHQRISSRLLT